MISTFITFQWVKIIELLSHSKLYLYICCFFASIAWWYQAIWAIFFSCFSVKRNEISSNQCIAVINNQLSHTFIAWNNTILTFESIQITFLFQIHLISHQGNDKWQLNISIQFKWRDKKTATTSHFEIISFKLFLV